MQIEPQFSVFLINRPGVLAKVTGALATAGVNLKALSLADSGEQGVLRMVTDDPDKTRRILTDEHDRWTETDVLIVQLPDTPGAFAAAAEKLADRHINISYVYATADGQSQSILAVFKPADMNKARDVLG
jgi:hypothetical protein